MDTDKLNRELQIFRNHVKIARENIIHKLVRDVRFWSAKANRKDGANARATKKLASLEPLIPYIRSRPASELAKAIIRFKAPKKNDASGGSASSSMEDRALIRFYENKKLQPEVRALIRRFGLASKMEVLDKYLKDSTGDARDRKSKGKKGGNKVKNKGKGKVKKDNVEQESEDQGFCEDDGLEKQKKDSNDTSTENKETIDDQSESEAEVGKFVRVTPAKSKHNIQKNKNEHTKKHKKVPIIAPPELEADVEQSVQIQDSFFVTASGQSYVATAPVLDKQSQQDKHEDEFSWKRSNKKRDLLSSKLESKLSNSGNPSWNIKQQQKGSNKFKGQREHDQNQAHSRKKMKIDSQSVESSDIHPSWAAKQKQRSIQPFSGKKIVFDTSNRDGNSFPGTESLNENLHPSWVAKQKEKGIKPFQGKKILFDDEQSTRFGPGTRKTAIDSQPEDVHPSWAAKQKQKGLQPFQGKKTTFDTIEEFRPIRKTETSLSLPTDLHPSWAAKQKEKGIQEFRGKKITFDE